MERPEEEAIKAVEALPPAENVAAPDFAENPIPQFPSDEFEAILDAIGVDRETYEEATKSDDLEVIAVDPHSVFTTQDWVKRPGVEHAIEKEGDTDDVPPTVVEMPDGTLVVADGNHRFAAALLSGDDSVEARILRLSDLT